MGRITPSCDFPSGDYPHKPEIWTMWGVANKHGVTLSEVLGNSRHPTIHRARVCVARALYNKHRYTTIALANEMNWSEASGQKYSAMFRKENRIIDMRGKLKGGY